LFTQISKINPLDLIDSNEDSEFDEAAYDFYLVDEKNNLVPEDIIKESLFLKLIMCKDWYYRNDDGCLQYATVFCGSYQPFTCTVSYQGKVVQIIRNEKARFIESHPDNKGKSYWIYY